MIPTDVFIQIGVYVLVVFAVVFIINRAMGGFIFVWFKVRRQRDLKLLVKVNNSIGNYFRCGDVSEGWVVYKPLGKKSDEKKRLNLIPGCVYRAFNVLCIDVDDEKNCVFKKDMSAVSGYDAEKNNSLHLRALYKPAIFDDKTKIILLLLALVLIAVIVAAVINYTSVQKLFESVEALKSVGQATNNIISNAGGI